MRVLINHSNHPSEKWSEEQKRKWDEIIDIPFPNIPADADEAYVLALVYKNIDEIKNILDNKKGAKYIYVAGEYTYCYLFYSRMQKKCPKARFAIPTTERVVEEKIKEDGSVEKVSSFRFVRWRVCS